ncbi:MAG TPA: response regulator [Ramlibacter sp.]|nr:response regulator [Ramlibacter sp.]
MSALRKVLVVDDDPVVGKSFNRVLSDKGYIVVTAADGFDALMKLKAEKYDVVFTDIKMPGMDGLEVAEQVKARQPWTPVVIVTGFGTAANEERARAAGVCGFLHKPLSPEMIEDSTANALRSEPISVVEQAVAPVAAQPAAAEVANTGGTFKNMALFLSAPFIGLLYAVLLPFVGLGMLAWFAAKALASHPKGRQVVRFAAFALKMVAAPFVGLAYIIVLPFAAMGMLAWMAAKALLAPARAGSAATAATATVE